MRSSIRLMWLAAVLFCGCLPVAASATAYNFQNIIAPYSPGYTVLTGINDNGDVVGQYLANGSSGQGFLYSGGVFSLIPSSPDYPRTYVSGINVSSIIVGDVSTAAGSRGFSYDGTSYNYIDDPNFESGTVATAINNSNDIVGYYGTSGAPSGHGFLYSGGSFLTLDDPSATAATYAMGINNSGIVVGYYQGLELPAPYHGFIYDNGVFETIDAPESDFGSTIPSGINDLGQIVGNYSCNGGFCGFLYSEGIWQTIQYPAGTSDGNIRGINNLGQIVGFYDYQGQSVGFIGTPILPPPSVPEPSGWALLILGFGALGGLKRRHRAHAVLARV